jgi:tetratricopeptide (TPR) repeat protein
LTLITIATDGGGVAAVEEWIRAAEPTHPSLVDEWHEIPRLYGMVNVPNAVWIDEQGLIVRPSETAGSIDTVRTLDRVTLARPPEANAAAEAARAAYLNAVRAWVREGRHALPADEAVRRVRTPDPQAAAHFRLGEALHRLGQAAAAERQFAAAVALEPDNWNYRRDALARMNSVPGETTQLSAQGASAAAFWDAVDALGDRHFYPPVRIDDPDEVIPRRGDGSA